MKQFHFLSGLPRCGSNLLTTLLNQHSKLWASSNSALLAAMTNLYDTLITSEQIRLGLKFSFAQNAFLNFPNLFYSAVDEPIVIDKNYLWTTPPNVQLADKFALYPKFIVLHRPLIEVLASYVHVAENNKDFYLNQEFDSKKINRNDKLSRNDQLGEFLLESLVEPYSGLVYAKKVLSERSLFIEYDTLVEKPQEIVTDIFTFLNLEVEDVMYENLPSIYRWWQRSSLGVDDFLVVRPKIEKKSIDPNTLFSSYILERIECFKEEVEGGVLGIE